MLLINLEVEKRFLEKVNKTEYCWEWTAALVSPPKSNYGVFWFNGKNVRSNRMAWMIWKGDIPESMEVLHKCDNPKCVNPDHLFIGTTMDNMKDKILKGRYRCLSGNDHKNTKIPEERIPEIIKNIHISNAEYGRIFDVSNSLICMIRKGKRRHATV